MSKKHKQQIQDALKLSVLYVVIFLVLLLINIVDASIKQTLYSGEVQTKATAQLIALLITYFLTLSYIKTRK